MKVVDPANELRPATESCQLSLPLDNLRIAHHPRCTYTPSFFFGSWPGSLQRQAEKLSLIPSGTVYSWGPALRVPSYKFL